MIASCSLQHIRHEFCGYGRPRFVLLVLAGVGEVGDYGGDTASRGGFTGVDNYEELHEAIINITGGGRLEYEDWRGGGVSVLTLIA